MGRAVRVDTETCEDRVQDIFTGLVAAPDKWTVVSATEDGPGNYMARAVINQAAQVIRDHRITLPLFESASVTEDTPLKAVAEEDRGEYLYELMNRIEPRKRREILIMRFYGGYPFYDISICLEMPLSTVKWNYRKAIERLREICNADDV